MNTIDVLQDNAVYANEEIARLHAEVGRVTQERDEAIALAEFRSGMIARLNDASVRDLAEIAELRRLVERMKSERSEFARVASVDAEDIARLTRERDTAIVEVARLRVENDRLAEVEKMWAEACDLARIHCPVEVGESHVRQGIPRMADEIARLRAELSNCDHRRAHQEYMNEAGQKSMASAEAEIARLRAVLANALMPCEACKGTGRMGGQFYDHEAHSVVPVCPACNKDELGPFLGYVRAVQP